MKNIDTINKDVIVGTKKRKFFLLDIPRPSVVNKTSSDNSKKIATITVKSNKTKRKGCSGCGRKKG